MTPEQLAAAGQALCGAGHGWATRLAALLDVRYDSLRHMLAGRRPVPAGLTAQVAALLAARRAEPEAFSASIAPPPASLRPEADRDAPCGDALDPALDALAAAAERAGWHPGEVVAAVLGWAVQRAADGAGEAAARQLLDDAGELLTLSAQG